MATKTLGRDEYQNMDLPIHGGKHASPQGRYGLEGGNPSQMLCSDNILPTMTSLTPLN